MEIVRVARLGFQIAYGQALFGPVPRCNRQGA